MNKFLIRKWKITWYTNRYIDAFVHTYMEKCKYMWADCVLVFLVYTYIKAKFHPVMENVLEVLRCEWDKKELKGPRPSRWRLPRQRERMVRVGEGQKWDLEPGEPVRTDGHNGGRQSTIGPIILTQLCWLRLLRINVSNLLGIHLLQIWFH